MAIRGRGPQVMLEGYARTVARGAAGRTMRDNIAAMDALVTAGLASDGNTVDGSSRTGSTPYDTVVAQFPRETLSAWAIPAPLLDIGGGTSNVVDKGADPSGVADSSDAFNEAIIAGQDVFVPAGTYRINGMINILPGTTFHGAGVKSTFLRIDQAFSPADPGVLSLNGYETASPELRDFSMIFAQPPDTITTASAASGAGATTITVASTVGIAVNNYVQGPNAAIPKDTTIVAIAGTTLTLSVPVVAPGVLVGDQLHFGPSRANMLTLAAGGTSVVGGTGIKYPPAVYGPATQTNRFHLENLYIGGAWDGISALGNVAPHIENIEIGSLNIGWNADGALDVVHVHSWRSWLYGFTPGILGAFNTYHDGLNIAWNLGRIDGLNASNISLVGAKITTSSNADLGGVPWNITGLQLDSNHANLEVNGGILHISSMYRGPAGQTESELSFTGGDTTITNFRLFESSTTPTIGVSGGQVRFIGGMISLANGITSVVNQTAGTFMMTNTYFLPPTVLTAPMINQTGGTIIVQGCHAHTATSGVAVSVAVDNDGNNVTNNDFQQFTIVIPAGAGLLGVYQTAPLIWPGGRFLNGLNVGTPTTAGAAANLTLTTNSGTQRGILINTGASLRWTFTFANAESGGNAGTDFLFARYDDSGNFLSNALGITRSTGLVGIGLLDVQQFALNNNPVGRQTVTGARGGNTALASLLSALAAFGLITDNTTA